MMMDRKETVNEHLKNNSTSDTEDEIRMRRRMAEQEKQHQPQMGQDQPHHDPDNWEEVEVDPQPG